MGQRGHNGFGLYFPVALAVKTPLAFLALLFMGVALVFRGSINIGVRAGR